MAESAWKRCRKDGQPEGRPRRLGSAGRSQPKWLPVP